jgi:hypothetical protein
LEEIILEKINVEENNVKKALRKIMFRRCEIDSTDYGDGV